MAFEYIVFGVFQPPATNSMTDDDRLMIRLQEGDNTAFDELVDLYQSPLIGFFIRNTRDVQLSEDLAQDTLIKLYQQSWDYLPVGRFRGWLFRIARNLLIDDIRRKTNDALVRAVKRPRDEDDDVLYRIAGEMTSPEDIADQREVAKLVEAGLARIPEEQRQTFTLHHYGGVSLPEIAQIMDVPLPTAKSRLRLAREKLAEIMRSHGILPLEESLAVSVE
jgi:RNA polymerase sigma-70 factor, ECF subfamily